MSRSKTSKSRHYRNQDLLDHIGEKLKSIRLKKGQTQEFVYNSTNVKIDRIERGQTNLTVSTLSKLCDYYNISFEDVLG